MLTLRSRLVKLEDRATGDCPVCGGVPTTFRLILDPTAPGEAPTPCPRCGKMPLEFTIAIERATVDEASE